MNLGDNIFHFDKVEVKTIKDILKNIKLNKAAGIDNISGRFLKDGSNALATPIAQVCNLSIKLSTVPDACKIAKLKTLYKKGNKTEPKNYRPISLLPLISKILEKVIHDQPMEFVTKHHLLYKFQSGFRKLHSTDSCLSFLQDKIAKGFDSGLMTGMILIDLQKAFDTIDHEILINKMKCMGFSREVTKWFENYLSNRVFTVNIEKSFSIKALITCGVPQGSILGPLLFLLYVNDMVQAVNCDLLLYADDSGLIFQHKDIKNIEKQLNENFSSICDWFVDNKLSIHFGEDKTKSILFAPINKCRKNSNKLNISYGSIQIKQYSKVTYLGCILDESLSGEPMALNVISKLNTRLKFLYRKNRFLTPRLRRMLCNALIQPHFDYACSVWYPNLNKRIKNKLQTLQNKCIRFCLSLDDRTHVGFAEFDKINWLPVDYRFRQCLSTNAFKFFEDKCPLYMKDVFDKSRLNQMSTRNSTKKLSQPLRRSNIGQNCISFLTPSVWNNMPNYLKNCENINTFKHKVKDHFFEILKRQDNDIYYYI